MLGEIMGNTKKELLNALIERIRLRLEELETDKQEFYDDYIASEIDCDFE